MDYKEAAYFHLTLSVVKWKNIIIMHDKYDLVQFITSTLRPLQLAFSTPNNIPSL